MSLPKFVIRIYLHISYKTAVAEAVRIVAHRPRRTIVQAHNIHLDKLFLLGGFLCLLRFLLQLLRQLALDRLAPL